MINEGLFKRGMRRLAAGVSIVTTNERGSYFGLVATAVSSVSANPPSLLVCINQLSSSHDVFRRTRCLCVNLLRDGDREMVRRFSPEADRTRRFCDREWRELKTGAPALVGSLASFDCRVTSMVEAHTHTIFVAEIAALELWTDAISPLIYINGRFDHLATS